MGVVAERLSQTGDALRSPRRRLRDLRLEPALAGGFRGLFLVHDRYFGGGSQ